VIRGVGYIEPTSEVRKLTFKIDGVIESCPIHVGQSVKKDEVLCTLRNNDEQSTVVVAAQEVAVAKADRGKLFSGVHPSELEAAKHRISALEVKLKFYQQRYTRETNLIQQKVSTEESLEQVTSDLQETVEKLHEARAELTRLQTFVRAEDRVVADAQVGLADANLAAAKARFNDTILRAPIDGTVLEILKREGEAVRIYDPTPVLVFGDTTKLRIRAEFDERFVNDVHVGQQATLFGRGMGGRSVQGKVTYVKTMMGKKTVFSRDSSERKDLEVLQVFIEPAEPLSLPVGLRVDVELDARELTAEPGPVATDSP
jgi:HlyD family secretion protein